jgi:alpha-tubulin suppressor-like RCC1 family protein/serine/threonine protein kinase
VDLQARLLGLESEYEVVRELGRGGSATVYLALERGRGRMVAIKVLHPVLAIDEEMVERMAREARTLARLRHSRIVRLYGTRRLGDGRLALILQYAGEETLRKRLHEQGALDWRGAARVLADVARALAYAHRAGVVHRDIKPENVYLDRERRIARLSDFGVAQVWDEETRITIAGTTLGTPAYMSPEQIEGGRLDGRSDVYSLGLIGYEMLTGRRPWEGESFPAILYKQVHEELPPLAALCPDAPPRLLDVLERAIAKRPERRWPSADAFLRRLPSGWGTVWGRAAEEPPRPERDAATPRAAPPAEDRDAAQALDAPPTRHAVEDAQTILFLPAHRPRPPAAPPPVQVTSPAELTPHAPSTAIALSTEAGMVPAVRPSMHLAAVRVARTFMSARMGPHGAVAAALVLALLGAALGVLVWERRGEPPQLAAAPVGERVQGKDGRAPPPSQGAAAAVALVAAGEGESAPPPQPRPAEPDEPDEPAAPRFDVTLPRLAAGGAHTCVLTGAGRSYCWGENSRGQLGTGSAGWQSPPAPVQLRSRLVTLATGFAHSCALTAAGEALCWGGNEHGQLGDGTRNASATPVAVAGERRYSALATGLAHSCALAEGGVVYCWGANESGQLGDDSRGDRGEPTRTAGRYRFRALAAGWSHTCALIPAGTAFCWGDNRYGQLGDGSTTGRLLPTAVRGAPSFRAIAAGGAHSCAVTVNGALYCWGRNGYGQLGNGGVEGSGVPVRVELDEPVAQVSTGASHSCALTEEGVAYCWGRNSYGQLGDGTTIDRARPVRVAGGLRFTAIASYGAHSCGAAVSGDLYCWGYNADGQLGDRTRANQLRPTRVDVR